MTLSLYKNTYFTEFNSINITAVLGYNFDVGTIADPLMALNPGLDSSTLSIFEFSFKIGNYRVPAGKFNLILNFNYFLFIVNIIQFTDS